MENLTSKALSEAGKHFLITNKVWGSIFRIIALHWCEKYYHNLFWNGSTIHFSKFYDRNFLFLDCQSDQYDSRERNCLKSSSIVLYFIWKWGRMFEIFLFNTKAPKLSNALSLMHFGPLVDYKDWFEVGKFFWIFGRCPCGSQGLSLNWEFPCLKDAMFSIGTLSLQRLLAQPKIIFW